MLVKMDARKKRTLKLTAQTEDEESLLIHMHLAMRHSGKIKAQCRVPGRTLDFISNFELGFEGNNETKKGKKKKNA